MGRRATYHQAHDVIVPLMNTVKKEDLSEARITNNPLKAESRVNSRHGRQRERHGHSFAVSSEFVCNKKVCVIACLLQKVQKTTYSVALNSSFQLMEDEDGEKELTNLQKEIEAQLERDNSRRKRAAAATTTSSVLVSGKQQRIKFEFYLIHNISLQLKRMHSSASRIATYLGELQSQLSAIG